MAQIKLTSAQTRVMKWLGKGWKTVPGAGMAIHVNGSRICNVDTMYALQRIGYVEQLHENGRKLIGQWQATEAGKTLTHTLGL